jgi:hypothetical protein
VTIPNSVTTLGKRVFLNCTSLLFLIIPNNVESIGDYAFSGCSKLTSIKFLGLLTPNSIGIHWVEGTTAEIRGHAYADSNFPASGDILYGLKMGAIIDNENELPVAGFTWTPSAPKANQTITFNASASNDPDGSIKKYEWDWNNDSTYEESYTTPTTTHSWEQAGSYPVSVRVTDDDGSTNTKTINISITSGGRDGNGDTDNKKTPGFELILVISAIAMILFLKRKRKNSD